MGNSEKEKRTIVNDNLKKDTSEKEQFEKGQLGTGNNNSGKE